LARPRWPIRGKDSENHPSVRAIELGKGSEPDASSAELTERAFLDLIQVA